MFSPFTKQNKIQEWVQILKKNLTFDEDFLS